MGNLIKPIEHISLLVDGNCIIYINNIKFIIHKPPLLIFTPGVICI